MAGRVGQAFIEAPADVAIADVEPRIGQAILEAAINPTQADVIPTIGQAFLEYSARPVAADVVPFIYQVFIEVVYVPTDEPEPPEPPVIGGTMPDLSTDIVRTQRHVRHFIQFGGPLPNNREFFSGIDTGYFIMQGVSVPELGGIDPVYVHDPFRVGRYKVVQKSVSPPDLPTATLVIREGHGSIPWQLGQLGQTGCLFNVYEPGGNCKDLSDFISGWTDYVKIYSGCQTTGNDQGDRSAWDSDDALETSLELVLSNSYQIGALAFGERAASLVDREVLDIVYGSDPQCGDCGPQDDGTKRLYAITKSSGAGSPGLPSEVIYSVDGGLNWTESVINGIGASEDPIAIDVVGDKLIVLSRTALSATTGGYYYSTINKATGVPGSWTKVTAGFVANRQPNDIYVPSAREVFIAADGGYIYRTDDITVGVSVISDGSATTNNLYRIHGDFENNILAVGGGSTVLRSVNRGLSFSATADSPSDLPLDITAVLCMGANVFWVGTALSGRIFYTLNAGETWVEKTFSGSGAGTIRDIVAPTAEVIYFSHDTNTPTARIFTTWDGGYTITNQSPRILNLPAFNRATRLAVPYKARATTSSNNIAIAGLGANGTDGVVLIGIASVR